MHDIFSKKKSFSFRKGQGSLEYLLLIGGTVLVATIVLLVIISSTNSTNDLINTNLTTYQNQINLGTGTGGGNTNLCGNNTIDGSEQCDGTDFGTPPADCTTIGQGFIGGTLGCNNTSCTYDVTNCSPPSGKPTFTFSAVTGSGAHQIDLTWDITSNFDVAAYNEVKAWVGAAPLITDPTSFQNATGADFSYSPIPNASGSYSGFGTVSKVGYTLYMVACNGSGVSSSNCTLSSIQTPTSGYDAVLFEAESMTCVDNPDCSLATAGLKSDTQGGDTFLHTILGSCTNAVNNFATLAVNLDNDNLTANYELWGLVRNGNNANAYNFTRTIDPAPNVVLSIPPNSGNYIWFKGPTTVAAGNGSQTARVVISCGSIGWLVVDKILLTTDTSCFPTGDGSNCT